MKKWKNLWNLYKGLGVAAILCMLPKIAAAEEAAKEQADVGILPPVIRDVLVILQFVLALILLVAVAVLWTYLGFGKKAVNVEKFHRMENDIKALTQEIRTLRSEGIPVSSGGVPMEMNVEEPEEKPQPWKIFVDDYNGMTEEREDEKFDTICGNFAELQQVKSLHCLSHGGLDANGSEKSPKFATVEDINKGGFWAWKLPEKEDSYAVVPNPKIPYDARLHAEGGMKEVFASNYSDQEGGSFKKIKVVLPAIFKLQGGNWVVETPGILRLEP